MTATRSGLTPKSGSPRYGRCSQELAVEAERLARTVSDPDAQADALSSVVTAHSRAGDLARAERVAQTITHSGAQADALSELATAYAAAGDHDQAERLARAVTDPDAQAGALSSVAIARARAGDRDGARNLLANALAVGDWHDLPLSDLPHFAVDALGQLSESAM